MFPTPKTPSLKKYPCVYPPSEDTFLLLDYLENHLAQVPAPLIALEIGSGSGVVSTFIKTLSPSTYCLATDINYTASLVTNITAALNCQDIDTVCSNLGTGLTGLYSKVDLLVFNPPYVPTDLTYNTGIEASWAGGLCGREVIDKFIPTAAKFLSDSGNFLLVGIKQNNPLQICKAANLVGLTGSVVSERKAGIEQLWIINLHKHNE